MPHIYVEPCDKGGVVMIATDGSTMVVAYDRAGYAPLGAGCVQVLKSLAKPSDKSTRLVVGDGQIKSDLGASFPHSTIDAAAPNWRALLTEPSAAPVSNCFDLHRLADFETLKVEGAKDCQFIKLVMLDVPHKLPRQSPHAALVRFTDRDIFAVIACTKIIFEDEDLPAWL